MRVDTRPCFRGRKARFSYRSRRASESRGDGSEAQDWSTEDDVKKKNKPVKKVWATVKDRFPQPSRKKAKPPVAVPEPVQPTPEQALDSVWGKK